GDWARVGLSGVGRGPGRASPWDLGFGSLTRDRIDLPPPRHRGNDPLMDRDQLAPLGRLRVGVFAGSPLSMVVDRSSGETCGVCYDLGAEFARRLGVPVE